MFKGKQINTSNNGAICCRCCNSGEHFGHVCVAVFTGEGLRVRLLGK